MRDVSGPIRKKYFELLNGVLLINSNLVPVYDDYIPNTVATPWYVIIEVTSDVEIPTKTSVISDTSVQLSIFTKDTTANSGRAVDSIAGQVYDIIYPTQNSKISLEPEFQVVFMNRSNDTRLRALQTNNAIFINRFITFSHKIYHRPQTLSI